MFRIRRAAPAEPTAEVSIYVVWCVMSAGISRQQMVTVCPLNFNTTHTHTPQQQQTNRNKQIHTLPIPTTTTTLWQKQVHACINTHTHTSPSDKSPPVSTMTSVLLPVDERGELRMTDWLKDLPLSLASIISACLSSSCCSICLLGRERKPFRPALTIKSPRGVSDNTQLGLSGFTALTDDTRATICLA